MEDSPTMDGKATASKSEQWHLAARIRAESSGWVVIWSARKDEFQARPLFRAPPDTVAVGKSPEELASQMLVIEQRYGKHAGNRENRARPGEAARASDGRP